jgi:hypothetical protein
MEWTIERVPGEAYLVVRTRGEFSIQDHLRMTEDILAQPFWVPGTDVLFDHREVEFGDIGFAEMTAARSAHAAHDAEIGSGKSAMLMGSQRDFGLGRQFELLTEEFVAAKLRVFLDEAEARVWLTDGGP